jgi:nucleoside-diphosphate-sugar epimerase
VRIFLAGATGVVGRRLLPRLVEAGHEVTGMTRSPGKAERIQAAGAEPAVCDALDRPALHEALGEAKPEVVVHHLTDLPADLNPRKLKDAYAANDRLRAEGTPNLVAAAETAGARRFVCQSIAFVYAPRGGTVKSEEDPLYLEAPEPFDNSVRAVVSMERSVLEAGGGMEGLALRFGWFYGPGTAYASNGSIARQIRKRRFPIVGDGAGVFSFVHIDDVVDATIAALDGPPAGIYNVVDDDPGAAAEWIPAYAEALGAKPPRRFPRWLATLFVGGFPAYMMTRLRGASNEKAKRELGWKPRWPSWRQGFKEALG